MPQTNKLPKNWKWVKLKEVCEVITGTTPPKSDMTNYGKDIPFFKPPHLWDGLIGETEEMLSLKGATKARIVPPNTVLVTCIGNLGRTGFVRKEAAFNQQINAILENENIDGKYIFYQAQSPIFRNQLGKLATGTTVSIVNKGNFETISIPLAPSNIQQAIVSKIDELFSELDKGIEDLKTAQQQLKTYRQSVLQWAFEGKLTNKKVKDGVLPKGWNLYKLGEYIENISSGKSFRCDERPPNEEEVGIVKVSSVTWGFFDEMQSKTCFSKDLLNEKYLIKKEDFLFSRANTIELIGSCVIVHKIEKTLMLSDKILRFIFAKEISKEYVLYYLRSRKGRKQIESLSTGNQDSMRNIGQEKIKQIEFPYCSFEEQNHIVQEIESRLSVADKMEESITQSLLQAEALRQSILKKAFSGELV
jgi:type I restriction enzyme S subunit